MKYKPDERRIYRKRVIETNVSPNLDLNMNWHALSILFTIIEFPFHYGNSCMIIGTNGKYICIVMCFIYLFPSLFSLIHISYDSYIPNSIIIFLLICLLLTLCRQLETVYKHNSDRFDSIEMIRLRAYSYISFKNYSLYL